MDIIFGILPFFNAGLLTAAVARVTGANMSILLLPVLLYMGATPYESLVLLLMFGLYNFFTLYTEKTNLTIKNFSFFPGWYCLIPIALIGALLYFDPFFGILGCVLWFIAEMAGLMYKKLPQKQKPAPMQLGTWMVGAAILGAIGAFLVQFIPMEYYYVVSGIVLLVITLFMWKAGKDRSAMQGSWDTIQYGFTFLTGLFGIEAADWFDAMRRTKMSLLSHVYPLLINAAMIGALISAYLVSGRFTVSGLFIAIGSAIAVRFIGFPEMDKKGTFSYLATGIVVLAVICLYLTAPNPIGLGDIYAITR